ncbi:MAG TPA: hypothetical protein VG841_14195 [Caulobacterales bacterium]|nr:hypothetical protein [Caulobacterales bacterium]
MRRILLVMAIVLSACAPARGAEFVLATPEQGAAALTADDDFMRALSPADLALRLKRDGGALADLRALYRSSTLAWSDAERGRLAAALARHQSQFAALARWLPETVYLAKNSEGVDGGLPHTRGATIFFGPNLPNDDVELDKVLVHELFHVLSRRNAAQHDALYALIGFQHCASVAMPEELKARLLTNPDAPTIEWVAPGPDEGAFMAPVLTVDPPHFTPAKPHFMQYLGVHFYAFTRDAAGACSIGAQIEPQRVLAPLTASAGRNTGYVIHPEEILADNFEQMLTGRTDEPDPWVYQRLAAFLGIAP